MFKYYNVATLEIIFSSSRFAVFDLKSTVIHLCSDFTILIFKGYIPCHVWSLKALFL